MAKWWQRILRYNGADNKREDMVTALTSPYNWLVYIIQCTDQSLYTGITTDIQKRYRQHTAKLGAKYFRGHNPQNLLYLELADNRSTASKREYAIKQLSRAQKITLIASNANQLQQCRIRKIL